MIKRISEDQVLQKIQFENPWWLKQAVSAEYNAMPRRLYFRSFQKLVQQTHSHRAVVLMGPRRVGKTVLLHHLVQELLDSGVPAKNIALLTIENPIYSDLSLEGLFQLAQKASGAAKEELWYILFDEVQYFKDWERHLKVLVDSYKNVRFVVSGSAAAALKRASTESGAGRYTDFLLPPLTFYEYINIKDLQHLFQEQQINWNGIDEPIFNAPDIKEANRQFLDYLNYGGYPEAAFYAGPADNPERYLGRDIVDKVLLKDLPGLYGITDSRELNALFTTIAFNTAGEFSIDTLSKHSQVQKHLVKKYIEYLEAAFLIKQVRRIDQSGKRFKRENFFKIYLTNISMRCALFAPISFEDEEMGNLVETAVFSQWLHRENFTPWYARWAGGKGEVDLVGLHKATLKPQWAVEIKWSNRYFESPGKLKSLLKFCAENNLQEALVTTKDKAGTNVHENLQIHYLPAASYAYTVGANSLEQKAAGALG
jgi:predicted AAA+ superfamily ATPase